MRAPSGENLKGAMVRPLSARAATAASYPPVATPVTGAGRPVRGDGTLVHVE